MASAIEPAIIAGASAVVGGVVVAVSNYLLSRSQGRSARRTDLRKALETFLSVVHSIDHQIRMEPQPGRVASSVNREVARLPQLEYVVGRIHQRLFQPHFGGLTERMHSALAAVLLIGPQDVMPVMQRISELMEQASSRDEEWQQKWDRARADLVVACRRALGEPVPSRA